MDVEEVEIAKHHERGVDNDKIISTRSMMGNEERDEEEKTNDGSQIVRGENIINERGNREDSDKPNMDVMINRDTGKKGGSVRRLHTQGPASSPRRLLHERR